MYLGIEIGGTKLQLGIGPGDGTLVAIERVTADAAGGSERIREQIVESVPKLLDRAGLSRRDIRQAAIGFGGPVDTATGRVVKSHQVAGWSDFPLADWCEGEFGWATIVHNDADTAGLAEACFGAGRGLSPIFYITIGSGIGGGLILDQKIYRGAGAGAAEIGHLAIPNALQHQAASQSFFEPIRTHTVESVASGWGMEQRMRDDLQALVLSGEAGGVVGKYPVRSVEDARRLLQAAGGDIRAITVQTIASQAGAGNELAAVHMTRAIRVLGWAIAQMIALICPRRIVIGGGVAQLGHRLIEPLRGEVALQVFEPFRGCYDLEPASLGESVVVHGALRLAACGACVPHAIL